MQSFSLYNNTLYSSGLRLNAAKCKVVSFGASNQKREYTVNNIKLENVDCIKDLGVYVSSPISFCHHIENIVNKANKTLGAILRSFISRDIEVIMPIYKSYVRSTLEFNSIVWSPYRRYLVDQIENVQRRFTRCFPHLHYFCYKDRLSKLSLLSLSARRLRYQLIFLYKLLNGMMSLNPGLFFEFSTNYRSRRCIQKIIPPRVTRDYRRFFFTSDIVFHWNQLTDAEVQAPNVYSFKKSVEQYFKRTDIW